MSLSVERVQSALRIMSEFWCIHGESPVLHEVIRQAAKVILGAGQACVWRTQTVVEALKLLVGQPRQSGFVILALERVFLHVGQRAFGIVRSCGSVRGQDGWSRRHWDVGAGRRSGGQKIERRGRTGVAQVTAAVGRKGGRQRGGEVGT